MSRIDKIEDIVLSLASYDAIGLWDVWGVAIEEFGLERDSEEARALCLEVIDRVISTELMQVGNLESETGFVRWVLPTEAALTRLHAMVRARGKAPRMGDIAWLALTEKGREQLLERES